MSKAYSVEKTYMGRKSIATTSFKILSAAYFLFIIYYTIVNGFPKHMGTYMDEWYYYGMAQCLAKGMGFPSIYGIHYPGFSRYLYSILITPAMLAGSRIIQFHLIALLNAIIIGSGIIPVYLLAKEVTDDGKLALIAGCIYLILPDMEFTGTFMTENVWLPVSIWTVFFVIRLIDGRAKSLRRRIISILLLVFSSLTLLSIKSSSLAIIIASLIFFALHLLSLIIKKIKTGAKANNKTLSLWTVLVMVAFLTFCIWLLLFSSYSQVIDFKSNGIIATIQNDPFLYLWCYIYTWVTEAMAIGFFPITIPLISYRSICKKTKLLLNYGLILTAVANLSIVCTSIGTTDEGSYPDFRLHQRYVMYLWIIFLIVLLDLIKRKVSVSLKKAIISVIGIVVFCFFFHGIIIGSAVDVSWLLWARNWMAHRWIWVLTIVLFMVAGYLLMIKRFKLFVAFFSVTMLAITVTEHVEFHDLIKKSYEYSYTEIEEVESFIREHKDSSFLVVTIPNDLSTEKIQVKSQIADTYLVYPNTYFVSGRKIEGVQNKDGLMLSKRTSSDLGIEVFGAYDLDNFDYLVMTTDMLFDDGGLEIVLDNPMFRIYRMDDINTIPHVIYLNQPWGEPGLTRYYPSDGFGSRYLQADKQSFVSGDEPEYVLYGPYASVPAGKYTVSVHYSYEGDEKGTIGIMGLSGSAIQSEIYNTQVYADQNTAKISFELLDRCESFEVTMFANVPGITIDYVDVDAQRLDIIETETYELHRYVKASNKVVRDEYYTLEGEKTQSVTGYYAVNYDYDVSGNISELKYYGLDDELQTVGGGYSIVKRHYNKERMLVREEYYDFYDKPILRTEGYHAVEYGYDDNGSIVEYRYYDLNNDLVVVSSGYAILRYQFNDARQVIREEYYDTKDLPVMRVEGYHAVEYDRDENGDILEYRYYGEDGKPILLGSGFAMNRKAYNESRQVIREEFYDLDYQPVLRTEGYYAVEYGYDAAGNLNEYRYYDTEEKPVVINSGYAKLRYVFNDAKQVIREEYYGAEGEPVSIGGYHVIEYDRDANGDVVEYRYFGEDGEKILLDSGFAMNRKVYNENRQVIREAFYDLEYQPVLRPEGYYAVEYGYDAAGNLNEYRYYDTEEKPVVINSGYAKLRYVFNDVKQVIREEYYGAEGEPVSIGGYHAIEYDRDANGDVVEYRYFGEDGGKILLDSGFAMSRKAYNENRQVIREAFYDLDYQPVLRPEGYYAVEYGYDAAGNLNEYRYYDTEEKPVVINSGYAKLRYVFNDAKQVVCEEYYGAEGEPVSIGGYHVIEYDRDANGDVVEYRYFGEDGEKILLDSGFAMNRKVYNENRQVIREEFYDLDYQPVLRPEGYYAVEYGYDAAGNINEYRYYDTEEKPVVINSGYAKLRYVFNDAKQVIREEYYGTEDEPVSVDGHHAVEYDRDENGEVSETRYYDIEDKPMIMEPES